MPSSIAIRVLGFVPDCSSLTVASLNSLLDLLDFFSHLTPTVVLSTIKMSVKCGLAQSDPIDLDMH